jgi:gliding motility-associated-like protein
MVKKTLVLTLLVLCVMGGYAQVVTLCPQNIGFEDATLSHWQAYVGQISQTGPMAPDAPRPATITMNNLGVLPGNHSVIKRGQGVDGFGFFSLNAPNGSDYVIKLGNEGTGRGAESISYTINVPEDVETYSVIFNYAVVFENPPHEYDEQPKFTAKVFDVTTNSSTSCGSFEFVAPGAGGGIPGFSTSIIAGSRGDPVFYKPWSSVLVNLTDYRGHTIRLEFTTNDCSRGGHFGYAYIDFNENCSIPITGNVTCPEATSLTLKVLPGFAEYKWFFATSSEEKELSATDSLILNPIPPIGTRIGVRLIPYNGLGCAQTLFTSITGISMQVHDPPLNCETVDLTITSVTVGNSSDLTYTYWLNAAATRPVADARHVTVGGTYYIKGMSSSGCIRIEPVRVTLTRPAPVAVTNPLQEVFPVTVDITRTFTPLAGMTYSYWLDKNATVRLKTPAAVRVSGTYYIKGVNELGCSVVTPVVADVYIPDIVIPNTFTPNGDGVNDVFSILINAGIKIKLFKIFNRWGNEVYHTSDITQYWDGLSKNTMVPVGVYYWILEGETDSKRYTRSGSVTVLR